MLFDWDAANTEHIARHLITPEEVEQVLQNSPFDVDGYIRNGEARFEQVGETDAGRVLAVITTMRGGKVRVVTAHPADRTMRAAYRKIREA